jgi:phosphatidylglycerophosphate synthase
MLDPTRPPSLTAFSRTHAVLMLGGLGAAALAGAPWPVALLGALSFSALIFRRRERWGAPNAVTTFRLVLAAALGTALHGGPRALAASVVGVAFLLDGVDGWLARRLGLSSDFGAHLDMEADAFLVLVVDLELWTRGMGAWILITGALRYAYVLALWVAHARAEMPRSDLGRYAFATLMIGLCAALGAPGPVGTAAAFVGTAAVTLSFGRSFVFSFARRA